MFDDFMNHTCNIYHLENKPINAGYGIRASDVKAENAEPDEVGVKCHFHIKSSVGSVAVIQNEPYSSVEGQIKLSLPIGTDIRTNDIVEDCRNGLKYRADAPREVYGAHHIIVNLRRQEGVKSAI